MTRLPFRYVETAGLYCADHQPGRNCPVRRNWHGLVNFKNPEIWAATETIPWTEFAVNNWNKEEVAVYLGLVWHLTEGYDRLVISIYESDHAEEYLERRGDIVLWEYDVDTSKPDGTVEEKGFVRSRTGVPYSPRPTDWQRYISDKAQLFSLTDFNELVMLQILGFDDACSQINVFGVRPGRRGDVAVMLAAEERPTLQEILQGDELFIDLCLGVDEGYNDALLIRSPAPLTERLHPLLARYEEAILEYEAKVGSIKAESLADIAEAVSAIGMLAHPFSNPLD